MTIKRLGALLLAVGLVVGAIFLRDAIDSDDSSNATGNTAGAPSGSQYTVVCSTEFALVCDQLADDDVSVTVESAGVTLQRLSRAEAILPDAWLTLDPFPEMLDDLRTLGGNNLTRVVSSTEIVGVSAPTLGFKPDRLEVFVASCGTRPTWACASDFAGQPWTDLDPDAGSGTVEVGIRDPAIEAIGLLEFANAVAGHYDSNDLDARPWEQDSAAFNGWLRSFIDDMNLIDPPSTPLSILLTRALLSVASTTAAEAETTPGSTTTFDTTPVTDPVHVRATFAVLGDANDALAASIGTQLVEQGWSTPAADEPRHSPSTFIALQQLWERSA